MENVQFPTDWYFKPTQEELNDINKLRAEYDLPSLENITRASQWFRGCNEIDECAADTCGGCAHFDASLNGSAMELSDKGMGWCPMLWQKVPALSNPCHRHKRITE